MPATLERPKTAANTRWTLLSLSLSMLMSSLDTSIANAGLPTIALAFHASFQSVQWVVLAYLLAITTLIVTAGRLGDMAGRRRLLLSGIALFTAASALCGLAPSLEILIAARAAQGLGAALMMALTMAAAGEAVPKEQTGRAMGLLGTMSALGTTLGPSVGGLLIGAIGWRAIFLVNVPLGLLNLALTRRHLPPGPPAPSRPKIDKAGTLLLTASLAAYALAMTSGKGHFGALNLALGIAAVSGLGLFVAVESRTASPLVDPRIFRNPRLRASLAASTVVAAVVMSTLVVGPFYLSRALHIEATALGFALSAGPLVAALAGLPAGRLVDRFGARRMVQTGLAAMAAGCAALALLPMGTGLAGYEIPIVCLTAGYALFQAANNTAVMRCILDGERGIISGMLSLSRNLGLITGASAMGAVFALASAAPDPATAPPAAIAAGMHATFALGAGLVAVAIAAFHAYGTPR